MRIDLVPKVEESSLSVPQHGRLLGEGLHSQWVPVQWGHRVHTNGLENLWSLLKHGIKGAYVSIGRFHLFRYNDRGLSDAELFNITPSGILEKRVTLKQLTGKTSNAPLEVLRQGGTSAERGKIYLEETDEKNLIN